VQEVFDYTARSMRLKISAKSTAIAPVNLYGEDFAKLVALFNSYCETVEISDDKAIYQSLDEAAEKIDGKITNIEIVGKNPNISLSLKNNGSWLAQLFDKTEMPQTELDQLDLAYIRIKEFLDKRRIFRFELFSPFIIFCVGTVIIAIGTSVLVRGPAAYRGYVLVVGWVLITALAAANKTFSSDVGIVSLKPKASATTFWNRKKDDLMLGLITAVLGAILGIIGTLAVQHFHVTK
jgi:hypothetical protein